MFYLNLRSIVPCVLAVYRIPDTPLHPEYQHSVSIRLMHVDILWSCY